MDIFVFPVKLDEPNWPLQILSIGCYGQSLEWIVDGFQKNLERQYTE